MQQFILFLSIVSTTLTAATEDEIYTQLDLGSGNRCHSKVHPLHEDEGHPFLPLKRSLDALLLRPEPSSLILNDLEDVPLMRAKQFAQEYQLAKEKRDVTISIARGSYLELDFWNDLPSVDLVTLHNPDHSALMKLLDNDALVCAILSKSKMFIIVTYFETELLEACGSGRPFGLAKAAISSEPEYFLPDGSRVEGADNPERYVVVLRSSRSK